MEPKNLRVGLIGAREGQGWASAAHIPAIRAVSGLELAAVATRSARSASAASKAFDIPLWFDDAGAMIAHPDIDLVSVVVKAHEHRPLVLDALAAGKPVYCEWPLGSSLNQTAEIAQAAASHGIPTAIGLQGRVSPWLRWLKDRVAVGEIGRVLSTTMIADDMFSTGMVAEANAYMLDVRNGANPLTIHAGHFLDALSDVLVGEIETVSALASISRPHVTVRETGDRIQSSSPDQILVTANLAGGAVASVHLRAGYAGDRALLWEIQGESGFLRIRSDRGYLHWRPLQIEGCRSAGGPLHRLDGPAADAFGIDADGPDRVYGNVARLYAAFAADLRAGTRTVPDFGTALRRHAVVEAIARSAESGARMDIAPLLANL